MDKLLLVLALAGGVSAAPRKAAPPRAAAHPAPETVFVQVAAPREAPRAEPGREYAPEPRRESASGPRKYTQAAGLLLGFYSAEMAGSTPYATLFWDLYPRNEAYFFEFTAGGGTVQSGLSQDMLGADLFEQSFLITLEALGGYAFPGASRGEGRNAGLNPYVVGGITSVYQGGTPNIGAVLGIGHRIAMPFAPKAARWVLNYGVRDHVYTARFSSFNTSGITQNFVLLVGVQRYL